MKKRVLVALLALGMTTAFTSVGTAEGPKVEQATARVAGLCEDAGAILVSADSELGVVVCQFDGGDLLMRQGFTMVWRACDALGWVKHLTATSAVANRFQFACVK